MTDRVNLSFDIDSQTHQKLKILSAQSKIPMKTLIEKSIEKFLNIPLEELGL